VLLGVVSITKQQQQQQQEQQQQHAKAELNERTRCYADGR